MAAALGSPAAAPTLSAVQQTMSGRTILAVVTGTGSRPLVDLEADDFVVDEGGEPREILSVHIADYPVALILDNTEPARGELAAMRSAASRFVTRIGERPIAIGTLGSPGRMAAAFDDPRPEILDRITRIQVEDGAPLAIRAAATGAGAIEANGAPFSAIVILSARAIPASQAADADFLAPVLDSHATVYVVADRMPAAPGEPAHDDVLQALAEQTGGQYTTIYSPVSYAVALDRIADRLASEMMIDYLVPPGGRQGDVRVGVRIPGATAKGLGVSK